MVLWCTALLAKQAWKVMTEDDTCGFPPFNVSME